MARVYGIEKKLTKYNIDEKLVKEIIGSGDLVDITMRMEKLLNPEITYQVLDSCACGISQKEINGLKKIEADTLKEKIERIAFIGDFHSDWSVTLNPDNTLTAGWSIKDKENFSCVCSAVAGKNTKVSDLAHVDRTMPLTYCLCCAGHCRKHLEKLLGIQLITKKIVSSPINSKGKKPCEFILEII